jgi:hypothetical protein
MDNIGDMSQMFKRELTDLSARVDSIEDKVSQIENSVAGGGGSVISQNVVNESAKVVINEVREIESRKKNIIVFNIPESKDASAEVRRAYDQEMFRKIGEHLGIDSASYVVLAIFRLGKNQPRQGQRARPVKIVLDSETSKMAFLAKIGVLRTKPFPGLRIGIKEDLSPIQQEIENDLKKELFAKRNDAGNAGKIFKIAGKKVIEVGATRGTNRTAEVVATGTVGNAPTSVGAGVQDPVADPGITSTPSGDGLPTGETRTVT